MAIKALQDFTAATDYEDRDGFHMQRLVNGVWKDYQISALRLFGDPVPTRAQANGTAAALIPFVNFATVADTIGTITEIFPDPGAGKAWVVVDCGVFYQNGTNFVANTYYRLYRASDGATVAKGRHDAHTGAVLVGLSHDNAYQFLERSAIYFETEFLATPPDGDLSLMAYAIKVDIV